MIACSLYCYWLGKLFFDRCHNHRLMKLLISIYLFIHESSSQAKHFFCCTASLWVYGAHVFVLNAPVVKTRQLSVHWLLSCYSLNREFMRKSLKHTRIKLAEFSINQSRWVHFKWVKHTCILTLQRFVQVSGLKDNISWTVFVYGDQLYD